MTAVVRAIPDFFIQMYSYREFLKQSVLRDLRNKYKRSVLGYVWTMAHPLAMMSVLAVVFSHIMRFPMKDYAVFLFAGLLSWNFFSSTAMMSLHSIRANARLFSQVNIPKYIFVLSIAASNLANLVFAIGPLLLIMLIMGRPITWTVLLFPVVFAPLFFVTVGISLILAVSNVFFDDTQHLAEVGLSMLYFLSPILYNREVLPPWLIEKLIYNPLFLQIEFIRGIFYDGVMPDLNLFLANCLISLLALLAGLIIFRKAEDKFLYFI